MINSRRMLFRVAVVSAPTLLFGCQRVFARQQGMSTPTREPLTGYMAGGERRFQASGLRLLGAIAIGAIAYEFDSEEHATDAFPVALENVRRYFETDTSRLQQASAPQIGDERKAYAGEAPNPDDPTTNYPVGLFGWRDGGIIVIMFAAGLAGDQLPELFATARTIAGRTPGPRSAAAVTIPGEMRRGGIWDVLPTLDDVPEGFVFQEDRVPGEEASAVETPTP